MQFSNTYKEEPKKQERMKFWKKLIIALAPVLLTGIITIYISELYSDKKKSQISLVNYFQSDVNRFPELVDPLLGKIDSDVWKIKEAIENTDRTNIRETVLLNENINKLTNEFLKLENKVDSMMTEIKSKETEYIDSTDYSFYTTVIEQPYKINIFKRFVNYVKSLFRKEKNNYLLKNVEKVYQLKNELDELDQRIVSMRYQYNYRINGIENYGGKDNITTVEKNEKGEEQAIEVISERGDTASNQRSESDNKVKVSAGVIEENKKIIARDSLRRMLRNSDWKGEIAFGKVFGKEKIKNVYFEFSDESCRTNYFLERYGLKNDTVDLKYNIDTTYKTINLFLRIISGKDSCYFVVSKIPNKKPTTLKFVLSYINKVEIDDTIMLNKFIREDL